MVTEFSIVWLFGFLNKALIFYNLSFANLYFAYSTNVVLGEDNGLSMEASYRLSENVMFFIYSSSILPNTYYSGIFGEV